MGLQKLCPVAYEKRLKIVHKHTLAALQITNDMAWGSAHLKRYVDRLNRPGNFVPRMIL